TASVPYCPSRSLVDQLGRSYPLTCRLIFSHRSTIGSTVSAISGGNIGTTRVTPISARRFTRSRFSPTPNDVLSIASGSRPASFAISRNFCRTSAISPRAVGIQPSPYRIARRAPYGNAPPTWIGGCGLWGGGWPGALGAGELKAPPASCAPFFPTFFFLSPFPLVPLAHAGRAGSAG